MQENVNGTVYFYTAPLTQSNNASPVDGLSTSPTLITDPTEVPLIGAPTVVTPDGVTPLLTQPIISDPTAPMYYIQDGLNPELLMLQQTSALYSGDLLITCLNPDVFFAILLSTNGKLL